ncbi:UNVERIFIED_CONTAM: hypothetical protein NCL1_57001 [Trichonephila clavipes]
MGTEEIQKQKEMKPSRTRVGTQTISFGEVMDLLEETQTKLKKLKATLDKKKNLSLKTSVMMVKCESLDKFYKRRIF